MEIREQISNISKSMDCLENLKIFIYRICSFIDPNLSHNSLFPTLPTYTEDFCCNPHTSSQNFIASVFRVGSGT